MTGTKIRHSTLVMLALAAAFATPASPGLLGDEAQVAEPEADAVASRLPPLDGHTQSEAYAINAAGEVAGWSFGSAPQIAVIWDPLGHPTALAPLPGDETSQAEDINDAGIVVGWSRGADGTHTAVRWGLDRAPVALPHLSGKTHSRARGLNEDGVVVGRSWNDGAEKAVMWRRDGTVTELSGLPGDPESDAFGINAAGFVVGKSQGPPDPATGERKRTAIVWSPDGQGTALAPPPGQIEGVAIAINDAGVAVGETIRTVQEEDGCAYLFTGVAWDRDGRPRVLPSFADGDDGFPFDECIAKGSHAADVTNSGAAAGLSLTGTQAVRWPPDGNPVALPHLPGDTFSWAHGLNEAGVAVGFSQGAAGKSAVIWR